MKINIVKPTPDQPYIINNKDPIILRVACSAGINRSACVREYLSKRMHPDSIIYPQYGAHFSDYENDQIIIHQISHGDGFVELFETNKVPNIQYSIFQKLGTPCSGIIEDTHKEYHLDMDQTHHIEKYKNELYDTFWNIEHEGKKNIFILINEHQKTIDTVIQRLSDTGKSVDLVIINVIDTIYRPTSEHIKPQSYEAYCSFVHEISKYFNI